MSRGWMIFVEGQNAPQKVHRTQASAWHEMHRLATQFPGKEVMLFILNKRIKLEPGEEQAISCGSHLPENDKILVDKSELVRKKDLTPLAKGNGE